MPISNPKTRHEMAELMRNMPATIAVFRLKKAPAPEQYQQWDGAAYPALPGTLLFTTDGRRFCPDHHELPSQIGCGFTRHHLQLKPTQVAFVEYRQVSWEDWNRVDNCYRNENSWRVFEMR